jgi:hypothetical protein
MNRREFSQMLVAGAATTAVPLPVGGAVTKPAPKGLYAWAVAMTKAQNRVSVDVLSARLNVSSDVARGLMTRLQTRGVVTLPNAAGVSRAVAPVFQGLAGVTQGAISATVKNVPLQHPKIRVSDVLDTISDDDPVLQEVSDEEHSTE